MDFSLTDEQLEYRAAAVNFARKELAEGVVERDRQGAFSRELWLKCAEFGVQGLPFPREYGGQGADLMTTVLVMEGLGYGCKDNGLLFALGAQMWSVQMPIFHFGSDEQKKKYLPKLCSGEWIGAHAMSEPDSGSDAFSLQTTAARDGDNYVLNGSKTFVTSAASADLFLTFATVDKRKGFMGVTGFVLEADTPGVSVGKPVDKMGLKTAPFSEVFFDECLVGAANRLGGEGGGSAIFGDSMEWERAFILAGHVGAMERQLEACVAYARERHQFGRPIGKFQSIANKIVDMKVRLETSRLLLRSAAWAKSTKGHVPLDAAMTKLHLSEAWVKSCLDAIQIHGGYGYTSEYEVERDLRDAVGGTLYSGTSEIQRTLIAQFLGL
jgi:alkylation response protein AidB-like acyl-CoA dehydrogenase